MFLHFLWSIRNHGSVRFKTNIIFLVTTKARNSLLSEMLWDNRCRLYPSLQVVEWLLSGCWVTLALNLSACFMSDIHSRKKHRLPHFDREGFHHLERRNQSMCHGKLCVPQIVLAVMQLASWQTCKQVWSQQTSTVNYYLLFHAVRNNIRPRRCSNLTSKCRQL